ncbi:hypothetical protein F443_07399 [Phytophthora nicotianae P1569]|uniref:Uncharacterized protein n=1 Tax=Phytophthora nicotianae P1569 TaxID=1317065 RepID=V9FAU7_PHYNI|nr:hypothetical protein F443_07399 [Phytophthora nicotianae P1569]
MLRKLAIALVLALASPPEVNAGLFAYGICRSGCNAFVVACYTGAGAIFGTVTAGIGTPPAKMQCCTFSVPSRLGFRKEMVFEYKKQNPEYRQIFKNKMENRMKNEYLPVKPARHRVHI